MLNTLAIVKAYGPRHQTSQQALQDWREGKDFRIVGTSTYMSIRDAHRFGVLDNIMILAADGGTFCMLCGRLA